MDASSKFLQLARTYRETGLPDEAAFFSEIALSVSSGSETVETESRSLEEERLVSLAAQRKWQAVIIHTTDKRAGNFIRLRMNALYRQLQQDKILLGPESAQAAELNLLEEIDRAMRNPQEIQDSVCLYIIGISLTACNPKDPRIKSVFASACALDEFNIPAQMKLRNLAPSTDHSRSIVNLLADAFSDCKTCRESAEILAQKYQQSQLIKLRLARIYFDAKLFDLAASTIQSTIYSNKQLNTLTAADVLSNILFLKRESEKLAKLAQDCFNFDRCAPETAVVIANNYSLQATVSGVVPTSTSGEGISWRERAVLALQKAVQVRPDYADAWMLLGHAFVELRNLPAAISAYNSARPYFLNSSQKVDLAISQAYALLGNTSLSEIYKNF